MSWPRALAAWAALAAVMLVYGAVRGVLLEPFLGGAVARWASALSTCVLIAAVVFFLLPWVGARTLRLQLAVGAAWAALSALLAVASARIPQLGAWPLPALLLGAVFASPALTGILRDRSDWH